MASHSDMMMDTMIDMNDLPNELMSHILSFLSDKELFIIESVSTKWKSLANKAMERITEFNMKNFGDAFEVDDVFCYEINDNNIDTLKVILTKCPNIKYFDWKYTLINGNINLI